jgi:NADP-dependent 3-hydroxy acid dehydrogenase YdfG
MVPPRYETALTFGAGNGLSASLARLFAKSGLRIAIAARNTEKLAALCRETGTRAFARDAVDAEHVGASSPTLSGKRGMPGVAVGNASARTRGRFAGSDCIRRAADGIV